MTNNIQYPKRLIEVDLPIKRISAHARREKSIRHGHISTLHIWWARRPLAACRAVICAALWPDPVDPLCPQTFRATARDLMKRWAKENLALLKEPESFNFFSEMQKYPSRLDDDEVLRAALLDFIADFANWDNSRQTAYLELCRALTQAAHEALGGIPDTKPLVVDPFAGGGSIPLEALRVGADAFASDLNPVAVLLNKVVLEYIPKFGQRLADEVRKWGHWIKEQAEKELAEFYPKDPDGATPIAYLWARTITCEGPGCGTEVPLIRSLWLAKQANRSIAIQLIPNAQAKRVDFQIITKQNDGWVDQANTKIKINNPIFEGPVKRGSATCPCCGYTTPVARVREQLKARRGGANDARMFCVVKTKPGDEGRSYRLSNKVDESAFAAATQEFIRRTKAHKGVLSILPDEVIPMTEIRRISVPIYGMVSWGDLFSTRQALALSTLVALLDSVRKNLRGQETGFVRAIITVLSLAISRFSDICNALCMWESTKTQVRHMFTRQAIGMIWDYAEPNIFAEAAGNFSVTLGTMVEVLERESISLPIGHVEQASATKHLLPEDSANALITDPPYYDAVPYAHLSDFFYIWLRRALTQEHPDLVRESEVPKAPEIVVDRSHELSQSQKGIVFYECELAKAFEEGLRIVRPDGIGTIVFASKTTASWEAILTATVDAGWIISGSWPIDTEMETRVAAQGQARLGSSIHLVCRPRKQLNGLLKDKVIGDWREVLQELPKRIHSWMPRLAKEGIVGADAIFACLGPALEIFSRYSCVEKASGEQVKLKEYLEQVWAAVSREALNMIFEGADATGFEEDARLTAMWLWTLSAGTTATIASYETNEENDDTEEESTSKTAKTSGFVLEFDAARKIAQGLGAHLDNLRSLVEVKSDKARLLPVAERNKYLFGKAEEKAKAQAARRKKNPQLNLFSEAGDVAIEGVSVDDSGMRPGETVLDRIHQSMLFFAAGRGEALKRFLVEDGVGRDERFWRLAQALSALYPPGTDEKRWVDGVLARKKGLGL